MTTQIYTLTDPTTKQVRYVGKSNNPIKRFYKHYKYNETKTHKNNWINKLIKEGKKPILEIIDIVPINEWIFWETYWISQFKTWGFKLVNSTDGGDGCTFGNQTSFKKGQVPPNKGKELSEEAKENLRILNLGKKQSNETKEKRNKKLKGRKVKDLNKLLKNGENTRFIKGCVSWNKGKSGYKLGGEKKAKIIIQLDLNNNFLKEFVSIAEAAKFVNLNPETIRKCCLGKQKSAGGLKYKYK